MREYKFRGKRIDNGEWEFGYLIQRPTATLILSSAESMVRPVRPETVGLYIGLYDKNGKEIYEGDIVRTSDGNVVATIKIGECYPEPVKYYCELRGMKKHTVHCLHAYDKDGEYLIEDNKSLEIIGNIYDNPEMLGGEKE